MEPTASQNLNAKNKSTKCEQNQKRRAQQTSQTHTHSQASRTNIFAQAPQMNLMDTLKFTGDVCTFYCKYALDME